MRCYSFNKLRLEDESVHPKGFSERFNQLQRFGISLNNVFIGVFDYSIVDCVSLSENEGASPQFSLNCVSSTRNSESALPSFTFRTRCTYGWVILPFSTPI